MLIPANSSRIRYLIHLRDNGKLGGIINCSEADDLSTALGQEYGKQNDILRNAFHHEAISSSHKANGDPIRINNPELALCVTGTPAQKVRLFTDQEDGLFSRFLFYTLPTRYEWKSAAPGENMKFDEDIFYDLGKQVKGYHELLLESPLTVTFTAAQWKKHTRVFEKKLKEISMAGNSFAGAILFRHGLMVARIASILTVLRQCEDKLAFGTRICAQEDFESALSIVLTSLEHSLLLSSSLGESKTKVAPLQRFRRLKEFLKIMPDFFTFTEMKSICRKESFPLRTAIRYLKKAEQLKLLTYSKPIYTKQN